MHTDRRSFLASAIAGGVAASLPLSSLADARKSATAGSHGLKDLEIKYAKLDETLKQPVFKRELFPNPVIIETLELLRYKDSFLCRVRSKDGAEGISISNLTPIAAFR